MRRAAALLLALALAAGAQVLNGPARRLRSVATLPATCRAGEMINKTGAGAGPYHCSAANTWTPASTLIKGAAGAWGAGYLFQGSTGAALGGYAAQGLDNALVSYWIGPAYATRQLELTATSLNPFADNARDLGISSTVSRWRNGYFAGFVMGIGGFRGYASSYLRNNADGVWSFNNAAETASVSIGSTPPATAATTCTTTTISAESGFLYVCTAGGSMRATLAGW